jgi:replication-associated recombination protein RarA
MNTQTMPSVYVPRSAAEFIGPAFKLATMFDRKAEGCRKTGDPVKILIYGAPGIGKTTLANYLASLLTTHPTEIESVNGRSLSVEMIRHWQQCAGYGSLFGGYTVKIVNELDTCPRAAQDLLLTWLDEIGPRTAFLGTSNLELSLLAERFQSRLQQFKLAAPDTSALADFISRWQLPPRVCAQIAVGSGGNVRAALLDAQSVMEAA